MVRRSCATAIDLLIEPFWPPVHTIAFFGQASKSRPSSFARAWSGVQNLVPVGFVAQPGNWVPQES
jgi:hypothetical protein